MINKHKNHLTQCDPPPICLLLKSYSIKKNTQKHTEKWIKILYIKKIYYQLLCSIINHYQILFTYQKCIHSVFFYTFYIYFCVLFNVQQHKQKERKHRDRDTKWECEREKENSGRIFFLINKMNFKLKLKRTEMLLNGDNTVQSGGGRINCDTLNSKCGYSRVEIWDLFQ